MKEPRSGAPIRLELDLEGFTKAERLVGYEIGNALLMLNLELQQHVNLRAEEYQVYLLIIMSTVQKFARSASPDDPFADRTALPYAQAGTISRRRIADVLGIPVETVRRIVSRFLDAGLIVEHTRGGLTTKSGILEQLSQDNTHEKIARRLVSSINTLIRLGAIEALPKD
jgi:hypothetical protein